MGKLDDRVALITGAGSGIGRALALGLAREGATVCLVGRRENRLEETATAIVSAGGRAWVHAADVSVVVEVDNLVREALIEHGQIDILINNAGVFPPKASVPDMSPTDWDAALNTNLRGPYLLMRALLPTMLDRGYGRVVNISAPIKHLPQASAYCASKAALDSLTKAAAFETRGSNVLINAVEPPFCDTEMHQGGASPDVVVEPVLALASLPDGDKTTGRIQKIEA